ncbi:MAG: hypothetical protein CFK52_07825 [Chloracidobacterium sp. CP2_5A]|nr:MAG: hypothetical protein CFK52_07825 [Chloracidobacterium sp. CP2_5A]
MACDIHAKPLAETHVRRARQPNGVRLDFTLMLMIAASNPLYRGLYRVEAVKSGQRIDFTRFRSELGAESFRLTS